MKKTKMVIDDSGKRTPMPGKAGFYFVQYPTDDYAHPAFWDPDSETIMFIGDGKVYTIQEVGRIAISEHMLPRTTMNQEVTKELNKFNRRRHG